MAPFPGRKRFYDLLRILSFLRHGWSKLRSRTLDLKNVFTEYHAEIWRQAASELHVDLERYPGGFFKATYNGRSTWIKDYLVQCDHHVMLELARNKPLINAELKKHNIRVPDYHAFTLDNFAPAIDFLNAQDGYCVVKPALDSAGGKGVTTHVRTRKDLFRAAIFAAAYSPVVMIERQVAGDVHRLLYLDGELIDALRRHPPQVLGDGHSTIRELIKAENTRRADRSGHLALKALIIDQDCRKTLKRAGLSLKSVPGKNQRITIKSTTNESAAHDSEAIRGLICDALREEGAKAASVLGFRLAGIDVITEDVGCSLKESGGVIIEINASPGLHYHYQVRNVEHGVPVAVPILRRLLNIQSG